MLFYRNCQRKDAAIAKFAFPFGQRGPTTVNAAAALVPGNLLFVTAKYGVGAEFARLDETADGRLCVSGNAGDRRGLTCYRLNRR